MKQSIALLALFLLCESTANTVVPVKKEDNDHLSIEKKQSIYKDVYFQANSIRNYFYENDYILINGNYSAIQKNELETLLAGKNKTYIFFDLNLDDNADDDLEVLKNNAVVYSYVGGIPCVDSFLSDSSGQDLISEINQFVNSKLQKEENPRIKRKADNTSLFKEIYNGSFRKMNKPYGYIDCDFDVKKYRANEISSLYVIESNFAFTPGKVATSNGSSGFESWYNKAGYIHAKAVQATNDVGYNQIRYGGIPVFKDAFPVNVPGTISITSSYSIGLNLGYSFKNGFSLDNITSETQRDVGVNISYGYSKTYSTSEPALSTQKNASDPQMYEWLYTYSSPRIETNHLKTGYLFEMNNHNHDMLEGDLGVSFNYKMTLSNNGIWLFEQQKSFSGQYDHCYY